MVPLKVFCVGLGAAPVVHGVLADVTLSDTLGHTVQVVLLVLVLLILDAVQRLRQSNPGETAAAVSAQLAAEKKRTAELLAALAAKGVLDVTAVMAPDAVMPATGRAPPRPAPPEVK